MVVLPYILSCCCCPLSLPQTLVCGLLGLPPVNGVLPQAPMHTRSLAHIPKRPRQQHRQHQSPQEGTNPADAADVAFTVHSSDASGSEWLAGSSAVPTAGVAAVMQSLSRLRLGWGAGQSSQQGEHSSATHAQQPEGLHAVTVALSHMHLDPLSHCDEGDSPFGTPTASAAQQPGFDSHVQQSAAAGSSPRAAPSSGEGAALRHRQRSLSLAGSQGGITAAGSSAPQQRPRGRSCEGQPGPGLHGRGRLHPSGSDLAINTLPDSAAAQDRPEGAGDVKARECAGLQPAEQQGSYLCLEVSGLTVDQ